MGSELGWQQNAESCERSVQHDLACRSPSSSWGMASRSNLLGRCSSLLQDEPLCRKKSFNGSIPSPRVSCTGAARWGMPPAAAVLPMAPHLPVQRNNASDAGRTSPKEASPRPQTTLTKICTSCDMSTAAQADPMAAWPSCVSPDASIHLQLPPLHAPLRLVRSPSPGLIITNALASGASSRRSSLVGSPSPRAADGGTAPTAGRLSPRAAAPAGDAEPSLSPSADPLASLKSAGSGSVNSLRGLQASRSSHWEATAGSGGAGELQSLTHAAVQQLISKRPPVARRASEAQPQLLHAHAEAQAPLQVAASAAAVLSDVEGGDTASLPREGSQAAGSGVGSPGSCCGHQLAEQLEGSCSI